MLRGGLAIAREDALSAPKKPKLHCGVSCTKDLKVVVQNRPGRKDSHHGSATSKHTGLIEQRAPVYIRVSDSNARKGDMRLVEIRHFNKGARRAQGPR